jgi:hypothetical protein
LILARDLASEARINMAWLPEQVLALAPDVSSASAGKGLGAASKWKTLGATEQCAWGTIQGSGKKPYEACIDLSGPAFKCTCPSRKFPCKHGLALFLVLAQQPAAMKETAPPAWVTEWLEKRTEKEEKKQKAAEPKELDPEAQAKAAAAAEKRSASREAKVSSGLDELGVFLADVIRGGFAALPSKPASFWETPAARLVDAQAPGLARRVGALYGITTRGETWPAELLREVSLLHLAREGWSRLDAIPRLTQADLRGAIGFTQSQEAVLGEPGVRDQWCVIGQRVVGDEERLRTQRTWLLGKKTGRAALSLSFSAGPNQPLDISLIAGSSIDAELVFFPSAFPLRALVKERFGAPANVEPILPHESIAAANAFAAEAFTGNPWIERIPLGLRGVIPQRTGRWIVRDASGDFLKLDVTDQIGWPLVALSGGHPIGIAGEWDGECFRPLSAWAEGRFVRL